MLLAQIEWKQMKIPQVITTKLSFTNKTKEPQILFVNFSFFPSDFEMVLCMYIFLNLDTFLRTQLDKEIQEMNEMF